MLGNIDFNTLSNIVDTQVSSTTSSQRKYQGVRYLEIKDSFKTFVTDQDAFDLNPKANMDSFGNILFKLFTVKNKVNYKIKNKHNKELTMHTKSRMLVVAKKMIKNLIV